MMATGRMENFLSTKNMGKGEAKINGGNYGLFFIPK